MYKEATHARAFLRALSLQPTRLVTPDDAEELKRDVWKAGTTAPVSLSMVLAGMAASSAILKATRRTRARTNRSPGRMLLFILQWEFPLAHLLCLEWQADWDSCSHLHSQRQQAPW